MTAAEERFGHPGPRQEVTGMVIFGGILALATALRHGSWVSSVSGTTR